MTQPNNHPGEGPIKQESLRAVYNRGHDQSWKHKKTGVQFRDMKKPDTYEFSLESYLAECSVLPETAKNRINQDRIPREDELPRMFEGMFPRGLNFCVVALPFMDSGFGRDNLEPERWEQFVNKNQFIKFLTVDPSANNLTFGLGDVPVYLFDYLPFEIKKNIDRGGCVFKLDYPFPDGDLRNRDWFIEKCKQAINNLGIIIRNHGNDGGSLN